MDPETLTCNPGTINQTRDTCLPRPMLERLVREWNNHHPTRAIQKMNGGSKRDLWIMLRTAMSAQACETEFCAMNKIIPTEGEKKEFKKYFRPQAPDEWKKDPDAWLSTDDIENVMEQYEDAIPTFEFIGPVPIDFGKPAPNPSWGQCIIDEMCNLNLDRMRKTGTLHIGIVFNLDPHDKPGSHWVSTMLDLKNKTAYYYDSFGLPPPKEIAEFLAKIKKQGITNILYNDIRHQRKNTECGMYSIYFLVSMLLGKSFSDICLDSINDERMILLRKIFFSSDKVNKSELQKAFAFLKQPVKGV